MWKYPLLKSKHNRWLCQALHHGLEEWLVKQSEQTYGDYQWPPIARDDLVKSRIESGVYSRQALTWIALPMRIAGGSCELAKTASSTASIHFLWSVVSAPTRTHRYNANLRPQIAQTRTSRMPKERLRLILVRVIWLVAYTSLLRSRKFRLLPWLSFRRDSCNAISKIARLNGDKLIHLDKCHGSECCEHKCGSDFIYYSWEVRVEGDWGQESAINTHGNGVGIQARFVLRVFR